LLEFQEKNKTLFPLKFKTELFEELNDKVNETRGLSGTTQTVFEFACDDDNCIQKMET
jgi:hypothetical protein